MKKFKLKTIYPNNHIWTKKFPEPKPGEIDNITYSDYTIYKGSAAGNGQPLHSFIEVIAETLLGCRRSLPFYLKKQVDNANDKNTNLNQIRICNHHEQPSFPKDQRALEAALCHRGLTALLQQHHPHIIILHDKNQLKTKGFDTKMKKTSDFLRLALSIANIIVYTALLILTLKNWCSDDSDASQDADAE